MPPTNSDLPAIPPPPPGADVKKWREKYTERSVDALNTLPGTDEGAMKLRKEIADLPSYKNLAQAAPVYNSMLEASGRDNRAADVNMIYGMAKLMDPGSVVREGEMSIAQAIATIPQRLQATVASQINSTGRLDPDVRAAIMQEAYSRLNAYRGMFDQDVGMFRGIAKRSRYNEADVIPSFGEFKPYGQAAATPAATPARARSVVEQPNSVPGPTPGRDGWIDLGNGYRVRPAGQR